MAMSKNNDNNNCVLLSEMFWKLLGLVIRGLSLKLKPSWSQPSQCHLLPCHLSAILTWCHR